jgi:uncharacterized protein (DUF1800 family)
MPSLNPSISVLGVRKAKHLLRRACFHYNKDTLNHFASLTPAQAVAQLSLEPTTPWEHPYDLTANTQDGTVDGFWIHSGNPPSAYPYGHVRKRSVITGWWWYNMMQQNSLKHKLTFFLHTCFTAAKEGSPKSSHFYDHLQLLNFYAYGNIQTLAEKISFDNVMLLYLDNAENINTNPNENYAREFLELFTILKGPQIAEGNYTNYSEHDVQQAARVFTGIKPKWDRTIIDPDTGIPCGYVNNTHHDTGSKTFSEAFGGQTIQGGSYLQGVRNELSDFVEMIFSKPETAKAYCRKLYKFFVKSEWNETVENAIIAPLANQLMSSNYNLLSVLQTLLISKHFYDEDNADSSDEIIGGVVKSPLQLLSQIMSVLNIQIPNPEPLIPFIPEPGGSGFRASFADWTQEQVYFTKFFRNFCYNSYFPSAGMNIFSPESVAGYPADYQGPDYDRSWFSSNTIVTRYMTMECLISGKNKIQGQLTGNQGGTYYENIRVNFNSVEFVSNSNHISNPYDSTVLVTELVELLFCESISEARLNYFIQSLFDIDPGYWSQAWAQYVNNGNVYQVKIRLDALFTKLINAAEFQLM